MAEATTVAVSKKIDCKSSNIHVMKNETIGAVYCKETNTFCSLAPEDADRLLEIQKKVDQGIEDEDTAFMEDVILQAFGDDERVEIRNPERFDKSGELLWLEIVTQTDCNLRCKYCYAHGGCYDYGRLKMQPELARKYIYSLLDLPVKRIGSVHFIGGEPLGNPEAILAVCETLQQAVDDGKLEQMPVLGIISNGTYYSESILNMVLKYNIHITFSIDGPTYINDKLRVFPNETGSSEIVYNNIANYIKSGLNSYSTESTYTKLHKKCGISPENITEYIYKYLGIEQTMVMICKGENSEFAFNETEENDEMCESVRKSYKIIADGCKGYNTVTTNYMRFLRNKTPNCFKCVAGISGISIAPDGKMYSCRMFCNNPKYCYGYYDNDSWNLEKLPEGFKNVISLNHNLNCQQCWAQYLCNDCPYWSKKDKTECKKKDLSETVILKLAEIDKEGGNIAFIESLLNDVENIHD